jgi:hypothetical protein
MGATDMSELTLEEIAGADYCFAHGHPINLKTGRKLIALARRSLPSPPQPEQREDEWISACGNFPKHPTTPLPAPGERVKVTGPIIGEDGYLKPKSEWPNPEEAMPGPNYVKKWEQETGTPFLPTPPKAPGEGSMPEPAEIEDVEEYERPTPPKIEESVTPEGLRARAHWLREKALFNDSCSTARHLDLAATALRQMQERTKMLRNVLREAHDREDVYEAKCAEIEHRITEYQTILNAKDAEIKQMQERIDREREYHSATSNVLISAQATIARLREGA